MAFGGCWEASQLLQGAFFLSKCETQLSKLPIDEVGIKVSFFQFSALCLMLDMNVTQQVRRLPTDLNSKSTDCSSAVS